LSAKSVSGPYALCSRSPSSMLSWMATKALLYLRPSRSVLMDIYIIGLQYVSTVSTNNKTSCPRMHSHHAGSSHDCKAKCGCSRVKLAYVSTYSTYVASVHTSLPHPEMLKSLSEGKFVSNDVAITYTASQSVFWPSGCLVLMEYKRNEGN
jgi:hypothetical protein